MTSNLHSFDCITCSKTFSSMKNLNRHTKLHSNSKEHKCSYIDCNKTYSRSDHLKRHLISHSFNPKPFTCDFCIMRFTNRSHLNRHLKKHIKSIEYIQIKKRKGVQGKSSEKHKKTAICFFPYCKYMSNSEHVLKRHIKIKHNRIGLISNSISSKYSSINQKYQHLISSSNQNKFHFKCLLPGCSKFYSSKYNLQIHINANHLNLNLICSYPNCGLSFKHRCSLKKHLMNSHCDLSIDNGNNHDDFNGKDFNFNNSVCNSQSEVNSHSESSDVVNIFDNNLNYIDSLLIEQFE